MKVVKQSKAEQDKIEIIDFGGLDLQPDILSRPQNSWRRAENVDLFTPGSVRKIVGPSLGLFPKFPVVIQEMFNYLRSSADSLQRLGVGVNGHLYTLDSPGTDLATLGTVSNPWVGLFGGTTTGGLSIQYVICTINGGPPVKWESTLGVTQVGVSVPLAGMVLTPTFSATSTFGYLMQVGIQYMWTYWNPTTLHESSPSPIPDTAIITPAVNAPPAATPYITQNQMAIPTPDPAIGNGYTRIRIYRSLDGGQTFFLLPHVYNGAGVDQVDVNFSVPRTAPTTTFFDGVAASNLRPQPDQLMVNPPDGGPQPGANNPPPTAIWGAVYQSRLWLLDASGRRLWFSNIGDFQSFGIFNFMDFSKDQNDTIGAIIPLSDRMIVSGKNSVRQITGTDFSDFVEVPIDMRRGIVGRRAAVSDGDVVYALTAQSVARLSFAEAGPPFVGDKVKPLTDTIVKTAWFNTINMEIDTTRSILFFAIKTQNASPYNEQILVCDLSRESPFTVITGLPSNVATLRELELSDGSKDIFFSGADGNIYQIYGGVGSLTATLETQAMPLDERNMWRVFKNMDCFGSDFVNWFVSISTDTLDGNGNVVFVNFGTPYSLGAPQGSRQNDFGVGGRQCVVRFTHSTNNGVAALMSSYAMNYENKMKAY